ncbi:MAG TPA: response regulator transcription factor [Myxococcota bacterium]|nr:response regulator transcription factor [Myxococcota bacterium]
MSGESQRILIVDDEIQIRRLLRIGLEAHGFDVLEATTVREGIARCADSNPDLVILDLGLPDRDGRDLIGEVRAWSKLPILVLSVRSSEKDKVDALDRGGSDYVSKPFSMAELLARVRALLRDRPREDDENSVYQVGLLQLDVPRHRVTLDGRIVKLSRKEFDLLHLLVLHAGRVVTHKQLLREIWGRVHEDDTQYLRVYVGQLREKLGDDPARPRFIANEPGVGYRFIEPD